MRLKLTALGTLWIVVVTAVWIWLGLQITAEDAAYFYYTLGLVVAGFIAATPFFIYANLRDHR